MKTSKNLTKGFTLLELLIVIAILAILSVTLVLILNPAESLKKSRDTQRMSDLSTIKTAIGLYLTSVNPAYLGGAAANTACKTGAGAGTWAANDKIFYSVDSTTLITGTLDGSALVVAGQVVAADIGKTDGTGWLPVNLSGITGGSPVSNMPLDPTNSIGTYSAVTNLDKVYRYACHDTNLTFEIDAVLESSEFSNKMTKDGGNNTAYYEVGTKLDILGAGTDF
ncbi:MAG: type II secretion system protein [bacterium]|nr:type II secretion system protein [bacterium]